MAIELEPSPATAPRAERDQAQGGPAAVAGVVAAALALGVAELVAGLLPGAASPVVLVGNRVIDAVPAPVKEFAIAVFGTADKIALVVGILVLALAAGAALGRMAARRFVLGVAGFAIMAALGLLAAVGDAQAGVIATSIALVVGVAAGLRALAHLLALARRRAAAQPGRDEGVDRRAFLRGAALLALAAAAAGAVGSRLGRRGVADAAREATVLPSPAAALPPPAAAASLDVAGISPLITPNADFYRIDTALTVPGIDTATWRLKVSGMVSTPFSLTYDELLAMDLIEADVTIACVSNEVGGNLVGTARWLGAPLADVFDRAGVNPAATQVVGRSVDGWTAGFPTAVARDGRDAIVAVAMNGEALPLAHGFPARLIVPGLYGYVSATKWLTELELTTWEAFDGYWVPRGWSKEGPIKTQSRIDVPRSGRPVPAGPTAIAGVAWAPRRGIERVEVRVDAGPWQEARLAAALGEDTWRQWTIEQDLAPGRHTVEVRATDGEGTVQPEERTPPAPDGAAGWHSVLVSVEEP